jgi:hypothetical protein
VELVQEFAQFGTDWSYVVVPSVLGLIIAAALVRVGDRHTAPVGGRDGEADDRDLVLRFADGAGKVLGLPAWAGATLTVLVGVLLMAFVGFLWDVGWHITVGRDEFLFSPPHVALLIGTAGMGVAGAVGVHVATRDDVPVGWQLARWRVPFGALALLTAGGLAVVGYWVDELWHAIYGLDVTMWSPPHMLMISSAVFSPMAAWLVLSEAGRPRVRWAAVALPGILAGAMLEGFSAWQLEYDFGVSQWSSGAQVVLIALAASMALIACRQIIGRGGALIAVGGFLVLRVLGAVTTAGVWSLEVPRFPLYLAGALAVEAAFAVTRGRTPLVRALVAGAGVATVGQAGEWAVTQVWGYHPWNATLWPELVLGAVVAVAAAPAAVAFGRVVDGHRPQVSGRVVVVGLVLIGVAVAPTLQRTTPDDVSARVTSTPAAADPDGLGLVDVVVEVAPSDAVVEADRFEVFQWQGGSRTIGTLEATDTPGRYVSSGPLPTAGERKVFVFLVDGSELGAIPVSFPADPEIGASAIPLEEVREQPFETHTDLFLREALDDAPAWPGMIAGFVIAACIAAVLGAVAAGTVGLDRRRTGATPSPRTGVPGSRELVGPDGR